MSDTLDLQKMIEETITKLKPYANLDVRAREFIKQYNRYTKAWNDFKEYHTHVRSVLLERFMV